MKSLKLLAVTEKRGKNLLMLFVADVLFFLEELDRQVIRGGIISNGLRKKLRKPCIASDRVIF